MVVSIKDSIKLVGIAVICFCAVFVCTFFINYYIDAVAVASEVPYESKMIYEGQLATAKLSCALSGCCLSAIALVMLVFYIKLYVDGHGRQLGILKAMGYQNGEIALKFWVFGLSVFIGALLGLGAGYAIMPVIYKQLTVEGLEIPIQFHVWLPFALVVAPIVFFSVFSCGYAYLALRRPVGDMLRDKTERKKTRQKQNNKINKRKAEKERAFLVEMGIKTLSSKKMLAFFVAFAVFCFSAMVQMGGSMDDLGAGTMGPMILAIGIVLAFTTMIIALTALVSGNVKNIAIMKAFGYSVKECVASLFLVYIPFALIGFGIGSVYQYLILRIMIDLFFKEYSLTFNFNIAVFFITLAAFAVFYCAVMLFYIYRISKIAVKEVMTEN